MKTVVIIAFACILVFALSCKVNPNGTTLGESIKFDTISKGANSGMEGKDSQQIEITDQDAFNDVWGKTFKNQQPSPRPPKIDFDQEMVIAVYMGMKNSGGFSTEIIKIKDLGRNIEVIVKDEVPTGMVTMALTHPYHMIRLPKQTKPIGFKFVN